VQISSCGMRREAQCGGTLLPHLLPSCRRVMKYIQSLLLQLFGWKPNHMHGTVFPYINPLNAELNSICHLLALLEDHYILHVSRIRVKEHYHATSSPPPNRYGVETLSVCRCSPADNIGLDNALPRNLVWSQIVNVLSYSVWIMFTHQNLPTFLPQEMLWCFSDRAS
jgi:hypothetical protein